MKRVVSLVLAILMLVTVTAVPVSAAEKGTSLSLSVVPVTIENKTMTEVTDEGHEYTADSYFLVKVNLKNGATEQYIQGVQLSVNYDPDAVIPYRFNSSSGRVGYGIAPAGFAGNVESAITSEGTVQIGLMTSGWICVDANETANIASFLFQVKSTAETSSYRFAINTEAETIIEALVDPGGTETAYIDCDYSEAKYDLAIKGAVPTLASVAVDKDEVGYASGDVITLSAESTSGKNVTDFVTFTIKDYEGTGLSIEKDKLTVAAEGAAPVGTYTVVATPDGTNCTLAEGASAPEATFTIIPKKITDPKVAITGFAKGNDIHWDLKIEPKDTAGLISNGVICYEGPGVTDKPTNSGKFKPDTIYTFAITLDAMENYELGEGTLTYTINGGESLTADIVEGIPVNGVTTYKAVVTATTAGKDTLAVLLTPVTTPNAHYGMKLSDLSFTGGAVIVAGDVSKTPVDGHFEWVNPNEDVGDPTVYDGTPEPYGRAFAAKFVPTDSENYAELSLNVRVPVHKATISIDDIKDWDYTEAFKYDGTVHTVELVIPEDLQGKIKVDYENNTATDVNTYKAAATISAVDDAHYAIYESVTTRELDWAIVKGDLAPTDAEKSVLFGTKEVTVTPADFGLTQDGIKIEVTHAGNSLITGYLPSDDMRSVTFMLRDTDKTDAANNASDTATLKFSSANYNETSGNTLTIKIINKRTDTEKLQIDVPATVTYGDTVTPSVGESKPAGAGDVTFKFFDKDNHEVLTTAQPLDAGTYKVTASCESESTIYTAEATFTVEPREIEAKDVAFDKELTYTGNELTQTVTVTVNGKTLTVGTDYTVSDLTGTEPGSYPVTVAGTGNYTGTVTKSFEIAKADISSAEITYDAGPYGYTGKEWKPEVAVSFNDAALTADTDYTVSYENNINAGTAKIIITGIGDHFTGSTEKTFTINSAEISGCTFAPIADVTYNTKAHTPEVTVAISGRTLEADKDYTVSYASNINAGTATVTVTGKGNFTGTASKTFTINKAGLTLNPCTISELCTETDLKTRTLPSDFFLAGETETGFSIKLTAVEGGDDIFAVAPAVVEGENKITFRLKNEVGAATFTVTVTPVSGNYNGGSYALTISTHDRTDVSGSISFPDGSAVYTGTGIKYENATISGHSGTLRYGYTPNASTGASLDASGLPLTVGTYTVAVTFNSDASFGYKTATFTITKATPTGTPGYTKLETSGKTLADAKLTVGTIRPAGTIAWDLPLTTVLEDGKAYAWTFTPNDTHNYTILTGTLIPYVDDGMDYIPGVIGGNTGSFNFHDVSRFDYFYDAVKWAAENGIASGTGRYTFSPNAVCTRAQTVTFLWRAAGSPLPRYRVCPFTDVQPSDYYYNAVLWAVEQGITTGLNATTFGPDVTVTRGQVATFLYRAASAAKPSTFNPFTDVKTTAYNYNAILWAYDNRITTGTSDTTFSPDAYCTRAQIVTFLYRYYQGR